MDHAHHHPNTLSLSNLKKKSHWVLLQLLPALAICLRAKPLTGLPVLSGSHSSLSFPEPTALILHFPRPKGCRLPNPGVSLYPLTWHTFGKRLTSSSWKPFFLRLLHTALPWLCELTGCCLHLLCWFILTSWVITGLVSFLSSLFAHSHGAPSSVMAFARSPLKQTFPAQTSWILHLHILPLPIEHLDWDTEQASHCVLCPNLNPSSGLRYWTGIPVCPNLNPSFFPPHTHFL